MTRVVISGNFDVEMRSFHWELDHHNFRFCSTNQLSGFAKYEVQTPSASFSSRPRFFLKTQLESFPLISWFSDVKHGLQVPVRECPIHSISIHGLAIQLMCYDLERCTPFGTLKAVCAFRAWPLSKVLRRCFSACTIVMTHHAGTECTEKFLLMH